jgi:hypothetical protein
MIWCVCVCDRVVDTVCDSYKGWATSGVGKDAKYMLVSDNFLEAQHQHQHQSINDRLLLYNGMAWWWL